MGALLTAAAAGGAALLCAGVYLPRQAGRRRKAAAVQQTLGGGPYCCFCVAADHPKYRGFRCWYLATQEGLKAPQPRLEQLANCAASVPGSADRARKQVMSLLKLLPGPIPVTESDLTLEEYLQKQQSTIRR